MLVCRSQAATRTIVGHFDGRGREEFTGVVRGVKAAEGTLARRFFYDVTEPLVTEG